MEKRMCRYLISEVVRSSILFGKFLFQDTRREADTSRDIQRNEWIPLNFSDQILNAIMRLSLHVISGKSILKRVIRPYFV